MGTKTGIEWTDATWNPIRGCSLVSKGCENCYAMTVAARFNGPGQAYEGLARRRSNGRPQWTGDIMVVERHMMDPLRWQSPRRIFVNSMSDLFHPNVTDDTIDRIFAIMILAKRHTFQVLTKRPDRMRAYISAPFVSNRVFGQMCKISKEPVVVWPTWSEATAHIHLGTSVEDQAAFARVADLGMTESTVRFLSMEPLLGPVAFEYPLPFYGVNWIIVGGESGPGARPMSAAWVRSIRDQCAKWGVPFFFKQWGEWLPIPAASPCLRHDNPDDLWARVDGVDYSGDNLRFDTPDGRYQAGADWFVRVGKRRAGRRIDGAEWDQMPAQRAV